MLKKIIVLMSLSVFITGYGCEKTNPSIAPDVVDVHETINATIKLGQTLLRNSTANAKRLKELEELTDTIKASKDDHEVVIRTFKKYIDSLMSVSEIHHDTTHRAHCLTSLESHFRESVMDLSSLFGQVALKKGSSFDLQILTSYINGYVRTLGHNERVPSTMIEGLKVIEDQCAQAATSLRDTDKKGISNIAPVVAIMNLRYCCNEILKEKMKPPRTIIDELPYMKVDEALQQEHYQAIEFHALQNQHRADFVQLMATWIDRVSSSKIKTMLYTMVHEKLAAAAARQARMNPKRKITNPQEEEKRLDEAMAILPPHGFEVAKYYPEIAVDIRRAPPRTDRVEIAVSDPASKVSGQSSTTKVAQATIVPATEAKEEKKEEILPIFEDEDEDEQTEDEDGSDEDAEYEDEDEDEEGSGDGESDEDEEGSGDGESDEDEAADVIRRRFTR